MAATVTASQDLTVRKVARAIGMPRSAWYRQCHVVSLALVRSGLLGPRARVARGHHPALLGQHSWAVIGGDCYDPAATVVDLTLWSYDRTYPHVHVTTTNRGGYRPHGAGHFLTGNQPTPGDGEPITLEGDVSDEARRFLDFLGPLDAQGWAGVANMPVQGWPAAEILAAMDDTPDLAAVVPIDRLGMLTDRNPRGLYF